MSCPHSASCAFYQRIEPHVLLRIRYASAFPYCKGGHHEDCAVMPYVSAGAAPPANLLPSGHTDEHAEKTGVHTSVVIIDPSAIFRRVAATAVSTVCPTADLIETQSFADARPYLATTDLVVASRHPGAGTTLFDLRADMRAGAALIVLSSESDISVPDGAYVVDHTHGTTALGEVVRRCLPA